MRKQILAFLLILCLILPTQAMMTARAEEAGTSDVPVQSEIETTDETQEPVQPEPVVLKGWQTDESGNCYYYVDGEKVKSCWKDIAGKRYHFNNKGIAAKGWTKVGTKLYYFYSNCALGKFTGFKTINSKKYYFTTNYNAYHDCWKTISGKKYYFTATGAAAKGFATVKGSLYYFKSDCSLYNVSGLKTIGNYKYYMKNGCCLTGWQRIGSYCYYFNAKGRMVTNKTVDGLKLGSNGVASGSTKKLAPLHAKLIAESITTDSMTKAKKIRTCFDWIIKNCASNGNPRIPHMTNTDWIHVYAYDVFGPRGGGNCFSYAASFAYLVRACGYKVYACNSSGHGWAEIDGKVYDPEQYKDCGRNIYNMSYSNPMIGNYKRAISGGYPWMHMLIPEIK